MCSYSMIADHIVERWEKKLLWPEMPITTLPSPTLPYSPLTQEEIDDVRELLRKAKEYDEKNNEPACELEEKKDRLRKLAKELGVEIILP